MNKINCKNCGQIVKGKFCHQCGQSTIVGRITMSSILNEFTESIFQIDRVIFFTLRQLFTNPGKSIREYLNGKRKKYVKPIAYLITFSTIYYIISKIVGQNTWMDDFIKGFADGGSDKDVISDILKWFAKNCAYTTLLLIPVFSFASFVCFMRSGMNYMEHIVINSYATGQQAILYSIFAILKKCISSEFLEPLPIVYAVSYSIMVFWQLFDTGSRLILFWRSVLTYFLYLVLSTGILYIILGISEVTK